jgi:exosome complex RNA-binding protein Csl4
MDSENNLAEALKNITKSSDEVYAKVCEVFEINQDEKTVNVKPIDDTAEIFNVRLQAESETGGLVFYPKIGSMVLVVFIDKNNAAVVNTGGIEKLDLVIKTVQFLVDKDGFLLKKENETLKILISDLIAAIKNLSFIVNTTGTALAQTGQTTTIVNLVEFTSVENRFNQFLK